MAAWCGLHRQVSLGPFLVLLLLVVIADFSAALTQLYCSSDNTGSEYVGGTFVSTQSTEGPMTDLDDS